MLETIFKMRIKKWEDSIAVLDANADNLRSDEQDAISALKNLWRTVAFGPSCTQRVERLVKVLSDADKLHGNNRDIIQASKDFRGVAKEMYTTDAETLEQFKDAMQRAMGGPRRSSQQQRQHEQQRQQQRNQSWQQKPQTAQPRPRQPQLAQPTPDSHNLFNLNRVSHSRSRNGSNQDAPPRKLTIRLSGRNRRSSIALSGLAVRFAGMGSVSVSA